MGVIREKLKHAFAVDPPGPAEPTVQQQPSVDWLCLQIARRRLTTPGLIFLEMSRPLNFLGAQAMHFVRPGIWALAAEHTYAGYVNFAEFLERRGSTEYLARRVEYFETEMSRIEKDGGDIVKYIDQHMQKVRTLAAAASPDEAMPGAEADEEHQ